jgi:predicted ATPase
LSGTAGAPSFRAGRKSTTSTSTRGGERGSLRWARRAAATAATHGFSIRAAQAAIFGGWARVAAGDGDGVDELRAGLDAYLTTGAELDHPYYLGLLGDAVARTAGPAEGLAVLEEAVELVGTARPFYYLPELHRLRGDLLAADGRPAEDADAYRRAMELAAGHGTRSAELRAAIGLCRLPRPTRPAEVLAELRWLRDQFEEGSAPPTCWPPGPCWRLASRAGAGGPWPR